MLATLRHQKTLLIEMDKFELDGIVGGIPMKCVIQGPAAIDDIQIECEIVCTNPIESVSQSGEGYKIYDDGERFVKFKDKIEERKGSPNVKR